MCNNSTLLCLWAVSLPTPVPLMGWGLACDDSEKPLMPAVRAARSWCWTGREVTHESQGWPTWLMLPNTPTGFVRQDEDTCVSLEARGIQRHAGRHAQCRLLVPQQPQLKSAATTATADAVIVRFGQGFGKMKYMFHILEYTYYIYI